MGYQYTTIDGQRVERNVADAFGKMRAAFKSKFGLDLLVSSGTRTRAEQQKLYDAWRNGIGSLAAAPGLSNHEEDGPRGPRALDLRDSGKDAGVTVAGSTRAAWLRQHAPSFGFTPAGYGFHPLEAWHYEYTGKVGVYDTPASTSKPQPSQPSPSKLTPADMLEWRWAGVQRMLKRDFGYTGAIDNIPGSGTIEAFQRFMNAKSYGNLKIDGIWGPATCKAAQTWLKRKWGYRGQIDALPGTGTKTAWDEAEQANGRAYATVS